MTVGIKKGPGEQKFHLSKYINIISLITVLAIFTLINKNFLGPMNRRNILTDSAPLLLMSAGVTLVLLLGSIDLSTGAICSASCVIVGMYITTFDNWIIPLIVLGGALAGFINGLLFCKLKVPSFISTLCTAAIWSCVAMLISGGRPGSIPISEWKVLAWANVSILGIPIMFVIALLVVLFFWLLQSKTPFGKSLYAIGANETAARLMGLHLDRTKIIAFALCGAGSALSGVFYAINLKSSLPTVGDSLNLMAIAAAALGGTALTGGKGSVLRTLVGVILVIAIQSGLNVVGVDAYWQQIVFGLAIIVAISANFERSSVPTVVK